MSNEHAIQSVLFLLCVILATTQVFEYLPVPLHWSIRAALLAMFALEVAIWVTRNG